MQLVKKITLRDIGTEAQLARVIKDKKTVDLINIAGIARGVKSGVSQYGDWHALTGDFLAVNCDSGEEFRSAVAILPAIAQDLVIEALKDAGATGVELAFTITAHPDDTGRGGKGYKFSARPLIDVKQSDEVSRLKALFPAMKPQLVAAPVATPAKIEEQKPATPAPTAAKPPAPAHHPPAPTKKK